MKGFIKVVISLLGGIVMIPALFAFAVILGGTVVGFMNYPGVTTAIVAVLGIISLPGIIIGWAISKR